MSQSDRPARGLLATEVGQIVVQTDRFERVSLEKSSVRVAESRAPAPKTLERLARDDDSHGAAPARQFDFPPGFGLVQDSGKV